MSGVSDERMAEVTNSRIRQGLKGVDRPEDGQPRACDHPYCENKQSPRLRRSEGVFDTLCWRHRAKRGFYAILTSAAIASPFAAVAWFADIPFLFFASVAFFVITSAVKLIENEPKPQNLEIRP